MSDNRHYVAGGTGFLQGINTGMRMLDFRDRRNAREEDRALRLEDRTRNQTRQDTLWERQDTQWDQQQEDRTNKKDRDVVVQGQQDAIHSQNLFNAQMQGRINEFNFNDARTKKGQEELRNTLTFMEGFYESVEGNDEIDGAKFIDSANFIFDGLIGKGKRISDVYPDDTGENIMFELEVEDGKGGKKIAPMTKNRSDKDDDEVVLIPFQEVFGLMEGLNGRLSEAGFDMSSPESRTAAFDAFHALAGDSGPKGRRLELKNKKSARSGSTPTIEDIMANYQKPDGSRPNYTEAFNMLMKGKTPGANPEEQFRKWVGEYSDGYGSMDFQAKNAIKKEYEETTGQKFNVTDWAQLQVRNMRQEQAAQESQDKAQTGQPTPNPSQPDKSQFKAFKRNPNTGQVIGQGPDGSWYDVNTGELFRK